MKRLPSSVNSTRRAIMAETAGGMVPLRLLSARDTGALVFVVATHGSAPYGGGGSAIAVGHGVGLGSGGDGM